MSSVEDEVVRLDFNNSTFSKGVNATLALLAKLKQNLSFGETKNGLDNINTSRSAAAISKLGDAADSVKHRFSAMGIASAAVIARLATSAVTAGLRVVKSFTLDPITAGFKSYETQINATQTIAANTGLKGAKGMNQINGALKNLQKYANLTVYNFADMAKNIGTFTAAGVKLSPATDAIKGIANLAAASGSSADQASGAMYQLSQALSAGTFHLQDYNSVVNAGIGGKLFQRAIYNSAQAAGTLKSAKLGETYDQWTKSGNNFRASLQSGFVTTKVLSGALRTFTGDQTAQQLKAQGYSKAQIAYIQETAKTAVNAATKIKTFSQLQDALKEEVATSFGSIFKTIFGGIGQATTLFSAIHTTVENDLTGPIYKFNNVLEAAVKLGARSDFLKGITNALHAVGAVLKPIHDAFREIFPPATAQGIANLAKEFENFTSKLTVSQKTVDNIKRTFAGFFAAIDIGKQIIGGIFHVIGSLIGALSPAAGGFLSLTGSVGDTIVQFDKALRAGSKLDGFFNKLSNILKVPIQLLGKLGSYIGDKLGGQLSDIPSKIQPAINAVIKEFGNLGSQIVTAFSNKGIQGVTSVLNAGFLGAILLTIRKFIKKGLSINVGGGIFSHINDSLEALTGRLKLMQQELKVKMLIEIAGAIALLTASVLVLASIDPKKLAKSMSALAVGFGELIATIAILTKTGGKTGFAKLPFITTSLIALAVAIDLLTVAVFALSKLNTKELAKGLGAIGILLAELSVASKFLSANSAGLIRSGIGLTALAIALNLLYFAVKHFGGLDYKVITKGVLAISAALLGIGLAMQQMPKTLALQAAGLLLVAGDLLIIYKAVVDFSKLSYKAIAKGIGSIAVALATIGIAISAMPGNLFLQSSGLTRIAAALAVVAAVIKTLGGLSVKTLAKGLGSVAIALGILAVGLHAVEGGVVGATALSLASIGLLAIAHAVSVFGHLSIKQLIVGLVGLAASFGVLALGATLLAPLLPALLGLDVTLLLLSVSMAAIAVSTAALVTALAALAAAGGADVVIIIAAVSKLILLLPSLGKNLALMLTNFLVVIGNNAPKIVAALGKVFIQLLDLIIKSAPKVAKAAETIIEKLLALLVRDAPKLIAAGFRILLDLLSGIRKNIGKIVGVVAQIIVKFLNALASHAGAIIKAGLNVLVQFLKGIASGLSRVVRAVGTIIVKFINAVSGQLGRIIRSGTNLIISFIKGIGNAASKIVTAATNTVIRFINGISKNAVKLANAGAKALLHFLNGLADAIETYSPQIRAAGLRIAGALVDGITGGLASKVKSVASAAKGLADSAVSSIGSALGINSPSRVFHQIGVYMGQGLANGVTATTNNVNTATKNLGKNSLETIKSSIDSVHKAASGDIESRVVIRPVIDLTDVKSGASEMRSIIHGTASAKHSSPDLLRTAHAQLHGNRLTDVSIGGKVYWVPLKDITVLKDLGTGSYKVSVNKNGKTHIGLAEDSSSLGIYAKNAAMAAKHKADLASFAKSSAADPGTHISASKNPDLAHAAHVQLHGNRLTDVSIDGKVYWVPLKDIVINKDLGTGYFSATIKRHGKYYHGYAEDSSVGGIYAHNSKMHAKHIADLKSFADSVRKEHAEEAKSHGPEPVLHLSQYNYSPKALNTTEIYRKTKALTAQAKRRLENSQLL